MFVALVSAFLGGLILNVMPCVFPVISLKALGLNDSTWVQFNVTNLFNKFYVGASSTGNATPSNTTVNFYQIGAPRTISGTINFGF